VHGRAALNFSSNDYLSLAADRRLAQAAQASLARDGVGAGASRLVAGDLQAHRDLEATLCAQFDSESALVFPSGYQANVGVVGTLAGPDDIIFSDQLNHASLIDGCRLSRARIQVIPHGNSDALRRALRETQPLPFRRRWVVTESVFSMDGDCADLSTWSDLAHGHGAGLIVDEAHAFGAMGPGGKGLLATLDGGATLADVRIGTFGKAFGAAGAFVLGPTPVRELLISRARSFLFTTAPPPSICAAAGEALRLSTGAEGDQRRRRLHSASGRLREGFRTLGLHCPSATTPIVPLIVGAPGETMRLSALLLQRGLFVQGIRPPTVPPGTSRLRWTLQADHTDDDIAHALEVLRASLAEISLPNMPRP
jgi:8-amino-7-oxononanoate synthase